MFTGINEQANKQKKACIFGFSLGGGTTDSILIYFWLCTQGSLHGGSLVQYMVLGIIYEWTSDSTTSILPTLLFLQPRNVKLDVVHIPHFTVHK